MRTWRLFAGLFVALASAALILTTAGGAVANHTECEDCEVAEVEAADEDTGATVIFEDGGSADASNESGAVLVHADDGTTSAGTGSGAVAAWADGGSTDVFTEAGAIVAHSDEPRRRSDDSTFFGGGFHFDDDRRVVFERRVTRLPATGGSIHSVVVMALAMIGVGTLLVAASRVAPRFAAARPS